MSSSLHQDPVLWGMTIGWSTIVAGVAAVISAASWVWNWWQTHSRTKWEKQRAKHEHSYDRYKQAVEFVSSGDPFKVSSGIAIIRQLKSSEWADNETRALAVAALRAYTRRRLPGSGGA